MKYIFLIIAVVLTLLIWVYVFSIKDKNKAMLKLAYLISSMVYLVVEILIFAKVGKYASGFFAKYAYLIQVVCLIAFLLVILISTLVDKYIMSIQRKEESGISTFLCIRKELEESILLMENEGVRSRLIRIRDAARYMNPVCNGVENEEREVLELIRKLQQNPTSENNMYQICERIEKLLEMRKIRNKA